MDGFAEAWSGNDRMMQHYADALVDLVHRAASAGLFQADMKPGNVLYRLHGQRTSWLGGALARSVGYTGGLSVELALTDFDANYCFLVPQKDRTAPMIRCLTVGMIALYMAMLKCQEPDTHAQLWEAVRDALLARVGPFLDGDVATTCTFLRETAEMRWRYLPEAPAIVDMAPDAHSLDQQRPKQSRDYLESLTSVYQQMVAHYAGWVNHTLVSGVSPECFKVVLREPLIDQLLEYCFSEFPEPLALRVQRARAPDSESARRLDAQKARDRDAQQRTRDVLDQTPMTV
jgi:hypothetical protein